MDKPEPVKIWLRASGKSYYVATTGDGNWFHLGCTTPLFMRALARRALGLPAGYPVNFYHI